MDIKIGDFIHAFHHKNCVCGIVQKVLKTKIVITLHDETAPGRFKSCGTLVNVSKNQLRYVNSHAIILQP
jgi:hypothetical protein